MVHVPERWSPAPRAHRALQIGLTLSVGFHGCGGSKRDSGSACPAWGEPVAAGTVADDALTEASGLVASGFGGEVLWTHNDDGTEDGVLFALDANGTTLGRLTFPGAAPVDWESVSVSAARGVPELLVGDIGDNDARRSSIELLVTAEPAAAEGEQQVGLFERVTITLPDGPSDAEAMLVDPATGRLLLFTRGADRSRVYAVDWMEGGAVTAELVATLDLNSGPMAGLGSVRAADVDADGSVVLRLTDGAVWFPGAGSALDALAETPCGMPAPQEADGEGVATAGGRVFFLGEGNQPTLWSLSAGER